MAGTKEEGIFYSPGNEKAFRETYQKVLNEQKTDVDAKDEVLPDHVGFTDSDFAGDSITLRSTSGSVLYVRGTAIAWSAKKQSIRAHSTTEAEYCAMHDAIRVTQSNGFLNWYLGSGCKLPLFFADNQSAIAISKSKLVTKRSKHFALRYLLVRDHFKSFGFCPSHLNLADPLTKGLAGNKYPALFDHTRNSTSEHEVDIAEGCYAVGLSAVCDPFHL